MSALDFFSDASKSINLCYAPVAKRVIKTHSLSELVQGQSYNHSDQEFLVVTHLDDRKTDAADVENAMLLVLTFILRYPLTPPRFSSTLSHFQTSTSQSLPSPVQLFEQQRRQQSWKTIVAQSVSNTWVETFKNYNCLRFSVMQDFLNTICSFLHDHRDWRAIAEWCISSRNQLSTTPVKLHFLPNNTKKWPVLDIALPQIPGHKLSNRPLVPKIMILSMENEVPQEPLRKISRHSGTKLGPSKVCAPVLRHDAVELAANHCPTPESLHRFFCFCRDVLHTWRNFWGSSMTPFLISCLLSSRTTPAQRRHWHSTLCLEHRNSHRRVYSEVVRCIPFSTKKLSCFFSNLACRHATYSEFQGTGIFEK